MLLECSTHCLGWSDYKNWMELRPILRHKRVRPSTMLRRALVMWKRMDSIYCAKARTLATSTMPWPHSKPEIQLYFIWNCVTTICRNYKVLCSLHWTYDIWPYTTAVWPSSKKPHSVHWVSVPIQYISCFYCDYYYHQFMDHRQWWPFGTTNKMPTPT